jgi:hypothetical protein
LFISIQKVSSMKTKFLRIAGTALAASLLLAAFADGASARERIRHGSASGFRGGSASWSHDVSRGPGYRSESRSRSVTGPNGKSSSMSAEHGCTAGSGCSRSVERTGPNGNTYNHDSSTTRNADGSISHTASTDGPRGATGSTSSTFNNTGDGTSWSRSKEATGPNGNSVSMNSSGSCEAGHCEHEITKTGPNGNSVSKEQSTNWGGGATRETTVTGPNSGEASRWVTVQ